MTSVMRPSGKLPPGVYWRRRLVVLTVVLLLVWLFFRVVGGGDDQEAGGQPSAGETTPAATPTPSAAASPTPTPAPKPRKAKDVEVNVRLAAVDGACPPDSVFVTPSVVKGAYAGRAIPVTLRVTSTAADPCTVRIDPSTFVLGVKGTDGTVWDTQSCGGIQGRTVDVHPTWSTVIEVTWDGRASADTCDDKGHYVKAGSYTAQAAILGGEPAVSEFTLVAAPKPTPTPPASPKPGATSPTPTTPKPGSSPTSARTP